MDAISLHDYVAEKLLDTHKPTYTPADEDMLREKLIDVGMRRMQGDSWEDINLTVFTQRTCECGQHLSSFDEYRDHLKNVMLEAQPK